MQNSLYRARTGREGEDFVAEALQAKGWTICARNWRKREGEIDIIALDGEALVFVEVKNWPGGQFDDLERVINASKRSRMISVAERYIAENPQHAERIVRFDVVFTEVRGDAAAGAASAEEGMVHIEGAFTEESSL